MRIQLAASPTGIKYNITEATDAQLALLFKGLVVLQDTDLLENEEATSWKSLYSKFRILMEE